MNMESPIPVSDIESVLAWVDTFKLSRPTKKINRDFSDAVLLAEMLSIHYPKLVEMHNYPPRNSHALKLNNWMTLNRKVLKKLKLNLCCNTLEQLANCAPGVIERVLIMVRDKIHRDEDLNKTKDGEQNLSSGGSYYEACGDDEHVLVVPVKTRVNGILETIQQKVVNHETYLALKEELKDAKDSADVLKQKVEHLDNLLKLKDERIDELQKQLERKQIRRKETEALQNSLAIPFDTSVPPSPKIVDVVIPPTKTVSLRSIDSTSKIPKLEDSRAFKSDESKISKIDDNKEITEESKVSKFEDFKVLKQEESKIPRVESIHFKAVISKPSITEVPITDSEFNIKCDVDRIRSDVFKEVEIVQRESERYLDVDNFKDSESECITTIEESIQEELKNITKPIEYSDIKCDINS